MKVSLVLCPFWNVTEPPLSMAILTSHLKGRGNTVYNFNLNLDLYRECRPEYKNAWTGTDVQFWFDESSLKEFIDRHKDAFDACVSKVIGTGSDLICFTVYGMTGPFSVLLSEQIKQRAPEKTVVFGGPECFDRTKALSLLKAGHADYVITGEGDIALPDLAALLESGEKPDSCPGLLFMRDGEPVYTGEPEAVSDLDSLPFPDYSGLIASYDPDTSIPVQSSRGCTNRCVYCNETVLWPGYRYMSGERIFREIEHLHGRLLMNNFVFHDSLINADIRRLSEFCDHMLDYISRGIRGRRPISWGGSAIIRPEFDLQFLKKMRSAGCSFLSYGIESGSQRIVNRMKKNFSIDAAHDVIRDTREAGIRTIANFMFGFPGETEDDFSETIKFLERNRGYLDAVAPMMTFCEVHADTYLGNNLREFDISGEDMHEVFWNTKTGDNDYIKRFDRFESFYNKAGSLGIKVIPDFAESFVSNRIFHMIRYYKHKKDYETALELCRKSISDG
ncbi:MAG: B12-binding domain-containing radical SAM protein [Elusimicrobia bacterium]|nr:B12-binding domain-containing radical SAM protein [Elusimicrobiota bacterium]